MLYFNKNRFYSGLVLLISFLVVFWRFSQIPSKLAFDELEFAKLALSLNKHLLIYSPLATGHTTPYFYLLLLSIKLFGLNIIALRLPAAICAVINGYLVFYLLRFYFPKKTAFLGALVFITSHWVLNFGRYAFEATYLLFWELLAIIAISSFLKNQKKFWFGLGLFASIAAFYSYLPGRIFVILPLLMLIFAKSRWRTLLTFIVVFTFCALPLIQVSGTVENRVNSLSYLFSKQTLTTKVGYFTENLRKNFLMLNFQGDLNGRHNYPAKPGLNPLLGILFWLGFFFGLKKIRTYWPFYTWSILSVFPSLFTFPIDNPHFLRTYTLTVSLVFFITLAIAYFSKIRPKLFPWLLLIVLLSSVYELRTYFKYQQPVFKKAFEKNRTDLDKLKILNNFPK